MSITNNTSLFFNENIDYPQIPDYTLLALRFENLQAVSDSLRKTFFLTDLYKKQLIIFNSDPELSGVFGDTRHNVPIDEKTIVEQIPVEFRETFIQYIRIIVLHTIKYTREEDTTFYFSFKVPFVTLNNQVKTIDFKVFPYCYFDPLKEKLPWLYFYQADQSDSAYQGQLTLHNLQHKNTVIYVLCLHDNYCPGYITLRQNDLKIFSLACQGFSEAEIATRLDISISSLKRTKATIMTNLNAQSTAQTVAILHRQGFI
jgi:DNA-binding CsgD family transcriptional regulator